MRRNRGGSIAYAIAAVAVSLAVFGTGTASADPVKCDNSLPGSNCEPAVSATGAETDSLPGSDDPPAMPEIHKVTQAGVFVEGVPITFEVTATDDVDDAAALVVTWTFSDGGTAAGKKVRHAFATAGKYTARVTVKDSDGNESWLEVPVSKPIVKRLGDRPRHR